MDNKTDARQDPGSFRRLFLAPEQALVVSFLLLSFAGAFLLYLPFSAGQGRLSFIDALFTSTSAVCVTGLSVLDISRALSMPGQTVLLGLVQLGGLGILTFSSLFILLLNRRVSVSNQLLIQSSLNQFETSSLRGILLSVGLYTFIIELAGSLFLFQFFRQEIPDPGRRLFSAVFHSVCAFCNAGFSNFSDNLFRYSADWGVNLTVMFLIVTGGIGFFVLFELSKNFLQLFRKAGEKPLTLTLHTRTVLQATFFLIVGGAVLIGLTDIAARGWSRDRLLPYLFLSVTSRTAGFNTLNMALLPAGTAIIVILLMFIGGASGSTAGGVKVTTAAVVYQFIVTRLRIRRDVELNNRRLPFEIVNRSLMVVFFSLALIIAVVLVLSLVQPNFPGKTLAFIFETVSAFGTVGLSLGVTPELTTAGKIAIIMTMFVGRVGPLTLVMALSRAEKFDYRFPEEKINIG